VNQLDMMRCWTCDIVKLPSERADNTSPIKYANPPQTREELGKAMKKSLVRINERQRRSRDLRNDHSPKEKKKKPVAACPKKVPMIVSQ